MEDRSLNSSLHIAQFSSKWQSLFTRQATVDCQLGRPSYWDFPKSDFSRFHKKSGDCDLFHVLFGKIVAC
jgi:hypothetical protein